MRPLVIWHVRPPMPFVCNDHSIGEFLRVQLLLRCLSGDVVN
jgi:hypothetical protein